jgi:hypothetical protein
MKQSIAAAVFVSVVLAGVGALAACPAQQNHPTPQAKARMPANGCVDFGSLPQLSATIIANEPLPARKVTPPVNPDDKPYNGPTLGLTKPDPGVKPIPTFGYHWSLD